MPKKSSTLKIEKDTGPAPVEQQDKLLDLDELVEPVGQFKLNGVTYGFVQLGSLGLIEQKKAENLWEKIQEIRKKKDPTKVQEETYVRALKRLMPIISSMPEEEVGRTEPDRLLQAVICFFSFRTASQVALVVRMAQIAGKEDLIGAISSQDLTGSGPKLTR